MMKNIIESVALGIVLTALSYVVGLHFGWLTDLNWLEVFAVATSYTCTWLCTKQSRWNYPIGMVTTAAYSLLFLQSGSPALAIFNAYLVFSLLYGWFYWRADEITRPVTSVSSVGYLGYGAFFFGMIGLFIGTTLLFSSTGMTGIASIDVILAGASGVAQLMMDRKKLQNWIVWGAINIVSIPYFIQIGLPLVAFQYVFFLWNSVVAYFMWQRSKTEQVVG